MAKNDEKLVQLSVKVTADERAALEQAATAQHRTVSAQARLAITKALKLDGKRATAAA